MNKHYTINLLMIAFLFLLKSNLYAGNTCNTATPLPNNMTTFSNFSTSPSGNGAGTPTPSCGNNNGSDIWFATTVGANGELDIVTLAGSMGNAAMAVYTGSCSGLTELACAVSDYCTGTQMPVMQFDGLTPNMPVYIRVWPENGVGGGTFQIRVSAGDPSGGVFPFTVTAGSATQSGSCIQLTTTATGQVGCAWNPNPVSFAVPFEKEFYMNFGSTDANGADGIVLGFQQTAYPHGASGGTIGTNGLPNSFFVEFDTWFNGQFADITQDHVAVFANGDMANPISPATALNGGNIEDGMDHLVKFVWTPPTNYQVFFDGALVVSGSYDMTLSFGASQMAFCGVTATTGGSTNIHTVCPAGPTIYPAGNETVIQATLCQGDIYPPTGQVFNNIGTFGLPPMISPMPNGCQSVVSTVIEVLGSSTNNTVPPQTVCGDQLPFVFAGQTFNSAGPQSVILPNANYQMCDSIIEFDLTILNPLAVVFPPTDLITCTNSSVSLNGAALSTSGPDVTYTWTGPTPGNGCFIGPTNTADVMVNCPGQYILTVVQTVNGVSCTTTSAPVTVGINISTPVADAGAAQSLDCATMTATLNGSNSTPSTVVYSWTGPNGFTSNLPTPVVSEVGTYVLTVLDTLTGCLSQTPSSVVVTGGASVTAMASTNSNVIDCNNTSANLDAAGSSMGTYTWTDDLGNIVGMGQTVPVTMAGTYTLTVDNGSGCQGTAQVMITSNNTPPTATITGGNTIDCNNTSTILTANSSASNLTYSWIDASGMSLGTGSSIVVLEASVVTLTVTDPSTGCSFSPNPVGVVDNSSIITADISVDGIIDCGGNSVTLTAMNVTGTATPTYTWTNASSNVLGMGSTLTVMVAGTYTVLVEDAVSGCETTAFGTVTQDLSIPTAMASVFDEIDCNNTTATLDGTGSSTTGGTFTYEWFDASNTLVGTGLMLPVSNGGDYTLFITNTDNGCFQVSNMVTVIENNTPPSATITGDNEINCNNTSATLTANSTTTGLSYSWVDNNGMSLGTDASIIVTDAATVTLTVTDPNTGCSFTPDPFTVVDNSSNITAEVGVGGNIICGGNTVTLTAINITGTISPTYTWTDAMGNILGMGSTVGVTASGTYTLLVEDLTSGCNITTTGIVTGDASTPTAVASVSNEIDCNNMTTTLDGTGSTTGGTYTYEWFDASNTSVGMGLMITVSDAGDYTLVVTNTTNNCSETSNSVTVVENNTLPSATITTSNQIDCNNPSATLTATNITGTTAPTYTWIDALGNVLGMGAMVNVTSAGTYTLLIEDLGTGCENTIDEIVTGDAATPTAIGTVSNDIDCNNITATLDGTGSSVTGGTFIYEWFDASNTSVGVGLMVSIGNSGSYTLVVTNTVNNCSVTSNSITVAENNNPPTAMITVPNEIDCNNATATLDGTGSTGIGTLSYSWQTTNGTVLGTGPTYEATTGGDVTLIVTDEGNGCESMPTVETVIDNATTISVVVTSSGNISCSNNSVTLEATNIAGINNPTFIWTDENNMSIGTTNPIMVNSAGTYTVEVTAGLGGCTGAGMEVVTGDNSLPLAVPGPNQELTCDVVEVTLNGSNSTTGNNITYEWQAANGTVMGMNAILNNISIPGIYTLIVTNTDNDCSESEAVEVTQNIMEPTAEAGDGGLLSCTASSITLDGTGSSTGMEMEYNWFNANNTNVGTGISINVASSGVYTIVVEDTSNGCTMSDDVTITQDANVPTAIADSDGNLTCIANAVMLDGTGSSTGTNIQYQWLDSQDDVLGTDIDLSVSDSGTYTLVVTDVVNGCSSSTDVLVSENTTAPMADAGMDAQLTCTNGQVTLDGSNSSSGGDFQYEWFDANNDLVDVGAIITVTAIDTYTLVVTNLDNGCSMSSEAEVTQDANVPMLDILSNTTTLNCEDLSIALDGSNSSSGLTITYQWTDGTSILTTNPILNVTEPGDYTFTIMDSSNGCEVSDIVSITQDTITPNIAIANDIITCANPMVTLDGTGSSSGNDFSYLWENMTSVISTDISTEITEAGTYQFTVLNDLNGCSTTQTFMVAENTTTPFADAGMTASLTCGTPTTILNGNNSSAGLSISYEWQNSIGDVLGNEITLEVGVEDTYALMVTNTDNGCSATSEVIVTQDGNLPTANITAPGDLTCFNWQIVLDGSGSSGSGMLSYQWLDSNGDLLGTNPNQAVTDSGTYTLTITDLSNNCSGQTTYFLDADTDAPMADAGMNETLTCNASSVELDGSNSETGVFISYQWLAPDGTNAGTTPVINATQSGIYTLTVMNFLTGCSSIETVEVFQDANLPTAVISPTNDITCSQPNVVLSGVNSTGIGALTFEWTNNQGQIIGVNPTLPVSSGGTYSLQVTDVSNGCSTNTSVTIDSDISLPNADAGTDGILTCENETYILSAANSSQGSSFSYTWEDDAGVMLGSGLNYTADEVGTYTLVVSNSSTGCSSESIVMVTQDITPPISLPTTNDVITCSNGQANITASGSTGGGSLTFEWLDALGNSIGIDETVTVNDDGLYELIVTDDSNGCIASENVLVTENTTPPVPSIEAVTTLNLSCNQNSIVVEGGNSTPLGMISYEWTLNGNVISFAPNPQVDEAGELILTVTDLNNGCSAATSVMITQNNDLPNALIANPTMLTCDITSIDLDGSNSSTGMEYLWTGPGTILNETSLMPTISQVGTYILSVTNTNNGCATTSEIIVLENVTPPTAIATANDGLDCNTLVVSLDGTGSSTGNVSYNWTTANGTISSGSTTLNPQVTQQGIYELAVTSFENGCTATATATVGLSSDAISNAEIEIIDPLCVGDMGTINIGTVTGGSGPYVYSLDFQPFTSSNTFNFLSSGNYTIVIEDAEGCQYSDEVSILQPQDVQVVLPADVRITLGEDYTLEPQLNLPLSLIETIEWTDGDSLSCTDCLNPISSITESSFYTIVVTTINGCKATASMWIYVEKPRDVFIPNAFSPDGNGVNDIFSIFADETMVKEVKMFRVFTRWGEMVYESTDFQPNQIEHGWDGYFKGVKMNPAVFVYLAEIEFIDGVTLIYKGDVTLKH